MFCKDFFKKGKIVFNELDIAIFENNEVEESLLMEDLLQVEYPNGFILDVGWYVAVQRFIVYIIKDFNWEEVVEKRLCENTTELKRNLEECVEIITELSQDERYKIECPCCNYYTIYENFDICELCFWQYDEIYLDKPDKIGGANEISLNAARKNYNIYGVSELRFLNKNKKTN